jgi:hypothetical protein
MPSRSIFIYLFLIVLAVTACKKVHNEPIQYPEQFFLKQVKVNNQEGDFSFHNVKSVDCRISFSAPVDLAAAKSSILFTTAAGANLPTLISAENSDSIIRISSQTVLESLTRYKLAIGKNLLSKKQTLLNLEYDITIVSAIDSTNKFPAITDDELLTLVQKQTFKYFWEFGHPVSGMARERNTSGEVVTSGGTGFGIMAIPVAIERKFISRSDGLTRLQTIADFLKNKAGHYHGAFSHWMNGTSGAVVSFGKNDNGADLVETSYLMMGLLTARQYFNGSVAAETNLRNDINALWNAVEWDWFRKDGGNMLFWNWSPDAGFAVNVPVQGWNECLITYVMAASSTTHSIPKIVYDNGFARNGAIKNGNSYYGIQLPLGQAFGGPLFFEHYSFLGINPNGLSDTYANYLTQAVNHSKINFEYCKANPKKYFGYSKLCWGLTASDIQNGYSASSPTNDLGVIAPTAAISSMPFTPNESLQALKFFYYKLGDKIWSQYGFVDAFSLDNAWFAGSTLAIDQGPQIGMIENYRTGLLWNLFMSCPEVQTGLTKLGFNYKL